MINLLRRINYSFCVNQTNFYAAESILNNFYHCKNLLQVWKHPSILISSKNNRYLAQKDPIQTITGIQRRYISETFLDSHISPLQRFQYTIDSLVFQLRRINVSDTQIYSLLNSMKYFPMATQLACREFVKSTILQQSQKPQQKQKLKQKQMQKRKMIFNDTSINQNDFNDLQIHLDQLLKLATAKTQTGQTIKQKQDRHNAMKKYVKICQFSLNLKIVKQKHIIYLKLDISRTKSQNNQQQNKQDPKIQKQTTIYYNKIYKNNRLALEEDLRNFFFQYKVSNENRLYSCLNESQINTLKQKMMVFADIQNFKKLSQVIKGSLLLKIVNGIKGRDYQGLLDLIFIKYKNKEDLALTIVKSQKQISFYITFKRQDQLLPMFNDDVYDTFEQWGTQKQRPQKILSFVNKITSKNCCYRAKPIIFVLIFQIQNTKKMIISQYCALLMLQQGMTKHKKCKILKCF